MSAAEAFADDIANEYSDIVDNFETILDNGVTPDEVPLLRFEQARLRRLQPAVEESAVTLRSISQMARSGVTRFPLAHTRREIADLVAYKANRLGAKNVSSISKKKRRVSSGNDNAA